MKQFVSHVKHAAAHPLAKGSMVVFAGSTAANVAAYAYHVIIGRLLGPVIYGEFTALMSLFYLVNIGSGVAQTILTKFFSRLRAKKLFNEIPTLFWSSFMMIGIISVIGLLAVYFGSGVLSEFLHMPSAYFIWLYFIFVSYIFSINIISLLQSFQMFTASSLLTNFGSILRFVFGVLGAPFGLIGVLAGNVISNIISYIAYFFPVWKLIRVPRAPLSISTTETVVYSVPALLATLGTIALYSQDVLLVKHFYPSYEAGIYASLAVLGKVIFYMSSALGYVIFPMVAERSELNHRHAKMVFAALGGVAALSLFLTLGYFLFPVFFVRIMYGSAFDGAIPYMGLFGIFITLFSLVNLLSTVLLAIGRMNIWMLTMGASVVQFVGLWFFHTSLYQVIYVNIVVTFIAAVALLVYYTHDQKQH